MLGTLSPLEIEQLLSGEMVARLGCHAEGRTCVVPVTYAYDGDALVIQSADGMKVRMRSGNGHASVYRIRLFKRRDGSSASNG